MTKRKFKKTRKYQTSNAEKNNIKQAVLNSLNGNQRRLVTIAKFKTLEILGDGSCCFNAVLQAYNYAYGFALNTNTKQWKTQVNNLRNKVVVHLEMKLKNDKNWESYLSSENETAQQHIARIKKGGRGDGLELKAMAEILKCQIFAHNIDGTTYKRPYGNSGKALHVLHCKSSLKSAVRNHYDLLLAKKGNIFYGFNHSYTTRNNFSKPLRLDSKIKINIESNRVINNKEWNIQFQGLEKLLNKNNNSLWDVKKIKFGNKKEEYEAAYVITNRLDPSKTITVSKYNGGKRVTISAEASKVDKDLIALIVAQVRQKAACMGINRINITCPKNFQYKNLLEKSLQAFGLETEFSAKNTLKHSTLKM
ncbi:MAG: hypothetical protein COC15_01810 [Legionellales bacterium]|nr:MAG: hypothetical protein COC15_01810 [Legionellales bacterium]